jgi:hypothetical protein
VRQQGTVDLQAGELSELNHASIKRLIDLNDFMQNGVECRDVKTSNGFVAVPHSAGREEGKVKE